MRPLAAICLFALLSACVVVPVPVPLSAVAPALPLATGAGAVDDFGRGLNAFRADQGRAPLVLNAALGRAARLHAADMVARGYRGHRSPDGGDGGDRARAAGYDWCLIAENLAWGMTDPARALQVWIESPGHRRNMLLARANEYGIAQSGEVWVLMLGRRC